MSKPLTKREILLSQIKAYDFYAGLIGRAVGGANATMPRWDDQRAIEYRQLADELRAQLAKLDAEEANAPAIDPGVTKDVTSPTGTGGSAASPEP